MTELGTIADGVVRLERSYPVDIETLWSYLTSKEGLSRWVADGEIGPDGVHLVFQDNAGYPITGKTLAWEPPRLAEFEWNGGTTQPTDSVVRFELTPEPDGTRLVLTHSRITNPGADLDFASGWHFHLDTLTALTAGAEPEAGRVPWEELHTRYADQVG